MGMVVSLQIQVKDQRSENAELKDVVEKMKEKCSSLISANESLTSELTKARDTIQFVGELKPKEKETTDGYVQETQKTSSMEYVPEAPIDDNRSGPKVSVDEN